MKFREEVTVVGRYYGTLPIESTAASRRYWDRLGEVLLECCKVFTVPALCKQNPFHDRDLA